MGIGNQAEGFCLAVHGWICPKMRTISRKGNHIPWCYVHQPASMGAWFKTMEKTLLWCRLVLPFVLFGKSGATRKRPLEISVA
ncbi:hypothetical protein BCEN4_740069 [Burkholderia cenocepacia]|nr:hypothetical protein BCEN4_740069 [Burkholderia cenocepacia]